MEEKIRKAFDAIESASSAGKFPRPLKTQAGVFDAWGCLKLLKNDGSATSVQSEVKDFFASHGFNVTVDGIGWRFSA